MSVYRQALGVVVKVRPMIRTSGFFHHGIDLSLQTLLYRNQSFLVGEWVFFVRLVDQLF